MAITYSDAKAIEWKAFKRNGGTIRFEIDAEDVARNRDFEKLPSLEPKLKTGFELPPTSLIDSPELKAAIRVYGSEWDSILCRIYLAGGRVIYKQQQNGKYEAICTV